MFMELECLWNGNGNLMVMLMIYCKFLNKYKNKIFILKFILFLYLNLIIEFLCYIFEYVIDAVGELTVAALTATSKIGHAAMLICHYRKIVIFPSNSIFWIFWIFRIVMQFNIFILSLLYRYFIAIVTICVFYRYPQRGRCYTNTQRFNFFIGGFRGPYSTATYHGLGTWAKAQYGSPDYQTTETHSGKDFSLPF